MIKDHMDMATFIFIKQIRSLMPYCMDYLELFTHVLIHTLHTMVHVCCNALHIQVYLQLMVIALTI